LREVNNREMGARNVLRRKSVLILEVSSVDGEYHNHQRMKTMIVLRSAKMEPKEMLAPVMSATSYF
jgi:ribosomal protein L20A (L18A)